MNRFCVALFSALLLLADCTGSGITAATANTPPAAGTPMAQAAPSGGGGVSSSAWLWVPVLLAAVWAAHWGAEHLAKPVKKLRRQWGLSELAGAAFIGLATASPELGINITSSVRGVANIGLGAMLGANIIAIPLVVSTAYWVFRKAQAVDTNEKRPSAESSSRSVDASGEPGLGAVEKGTLPVQREAVTVQVLPYLAILALVAVLTIPSAWRGLQPLDGWIMLGAYLVYLAQAVFRGRQEREGVEWTRREIAIALGGLIALAAGAYFIVFSTENLVSAFGISGLIGGLFITAPLAALPETFAVWNVVRSGQVTAGTTAVLGDLAVTMTVAFLPLALITVAVEDLQLYVVNLIFLALIPALYAVFIRWDSRSAGLTLWQVLALDGVYLVYLAVMLFGVLDVF